MDTTLTLLLTIKVPLTPALRRELSWEAATERLMKSALITRDMQWRSRVFLDKFIAWAHEGLSKGKHGDMIRTLAGGRSAAGQHVYTGEYGFAADPESVIKKQKHAESATSAAQSLPSLDDTTTEL